MLTFSVQNSGSIHSVSQPGRSDLKCLGVQRQIMMHVLTISMGTLSIATATLPGALVRPLLRRRGSATFLRFVTPKRAIDANLLNTQRCGFNFFYDLFLE